MRFFIFWVCSLVLVSAHGANFTLNTSVHDTDFDWTLGDNYEGGSAPTGDADTVIIPADVIAKVTAGDNASYNLINSIKRIKPLAGAKLLVAVEGENVTNALECIVSSLDHQAELGKPGGILEKTGSGTLILGNGAARRIFKGTYGYDYAVDMTVTEGTLVLPQNNDPDRKWLVVGSVHIAESASFMLSSPTNFSVYAYGLFGAGTMFYPNNDVSSDGKTQYVVFNVNAADEIEQSVFSGMISGFVKFQVTHPAVVHLTGIDSDFSGTPVVAGRLGVKYFGNEKEVSSIGIGNVNFSGTDCVVEYLGTEKEETNHPFWWTAYSTIDAGFFGGVTFTGKFSYTKAGQYVVHLTGSNTTECVLANEFVSALNDDKTLKTTPCVKKSGSGTWRMADNAKRNIHGVVAVEDGTLKFDSIAERGVPCSLGYSDVLRECINGAFDELASVDYAFLLGGNNTTGTLEYAGTVDAGNATRKMAVQSNGRFISDSALFRLEDVSSLGTGVKTLTLAGKSTHGNYATGFSDGAEEGSKLAVDKEGVGTWDLVRPTSFTGPLTSRGGVLRVDNRPYRWYRICFTENGYGSSRYDTTYSLGMNDDGTGVSPSKAEISSIQMLEVALYDAEGNNLLSGFMTGEPLSGDFTSQESKSVVIDSAISNPTFKDDGQLCNLFDNKNTKMVGYTSVKNGITLGNTSSWIAFVARLPEDAAEAVKIDFLSSLSTNSTPKSYNGRILTAFRLDASLDGINWEEGIVRNDALIAPENGARWYSDPKGDLSYNKRPGKGFAIKQTSPVGHAFTAVGAADGGVLEIVGAPYTVSGLVIDAAASAGRISNVAFAADGCIDIRNVASLDFDSLELPGDYSQLEGYANLSSWKLRINGELNERLIVSSYRGKITLKRRGLKIIIR